MHDKKLHLCVVELWEVADVEADGLGVLGAGVHDVADEEDQLEQLGELLALPNLLARRRRRHDVRLAVLNRIHD